jgi:hypothetical protein
MKTGPHLLASIVNLNDGVGETTEQGWPTECGGLKLDLPQASARRTNTGTSSSPRCSPTKLAVQGNCLSRRHCDADGLAVGMPGSPMKNQIEGREQT